ncbi:hypothetical protein E4U52_007395 [Claviceps spartinae]|nr:hypothetical protein E4U52_007395 [Claviceps spartinae]
MSSSSNTRTNALRAGGACVRCRKGKTRCVYENGQLPCKNCSKGMHDCYLPSNSRQHHYGPPPSPALRQPSAHRRPVREALPAAGPGAGASEARHAPVTGSASSARGAPMGPEKLTPELIAECERVISKTFPACVAFHKPSFVQHLKKASLNSSLVSGLLTCAARSSPVLIRRYGSPTLAAETFAAKTIVLVNQNLDQPSLSDIQALCLVVIHEWGSRNAVRAYIYLGQAARMLHMYQVSGECNNPNMGNQFLRQESLRRTLWLVYILDCLLTTTSGRFTALGTQDIATVPLPCLDINFAFANPVSVNTLPEYFSRCGKIIQDSSDETPNKSLEKSPRGSLAKSSAPVSCSATVGEIGELGYIVLASRIWYDVVRMLTTTTVATFCEADCDGLLANIEGFRASLPMQLVEEPEHVNMHVAMGSEYTYAMLHCLLHGASLLARRRLLLQAVMSPDFNFDAFRLTPRCRDLVDRVFASCHSVSLLLNALDTGTEKDTPTCLPIEMLFCAFITSATVAWLSLKGFTPPAAVETAAHMVCDGVRFIHNGAESWPLVATWLKHVVVMQRVLIMHARSASESSNSSSSRRGSDPPHNRSSVKAEVSSHADSDPDAMDHHQHAEAAGGETPAPVAPVARVVSESVRGDSETPASVSRRGVTTINGGSGAAAHATAASGTRSHAGAPQALMQPSDGNNSSPGASPSPAPVPVPQDGWTTSHQDMTPTELCHALERQLLDHDDLAAFMGGGV